LAQEFVKLVQFYLRVNHRRVILIPTSPSDIDSSLASSVYVSTYVHPIAAMTFMIIQRPQETVKVDLKLRQASQALAGHEHVEIPYTHV
jgi:hypothetical protein